MPALGVVEAITYRCAISADGITVAGTVPVLG